MHVFESPREPRVFAIHSVWTAESAFEHHAGLPHTVRFLEAATPLLTHPIERLRLREISSIP
jgi:quinol monooxygenase YgiN